MSEATHSGILDSLARLDGRLLRMVETARVQTGREPGADPFRGLYVSETDFFRYVSGEGTVIRGRVAPLAGGESFEALQGVYGLTSFELDTLIIALAPEVDLRYERIFAYLQDDVSRK